MIYECLKNWKICNIQQAVYTQVVLHTSCVNYKIEDLKNVFSLNFQFIVPTDVFYELRLLIKSKIFGIKARYILEHTRTSKINWDLSNIYVNSNELVQYSSISDGPLIFVFGDLNIADEFLKYSLNAKDIYVFLPPENWSCISGTPVIMNLETVKKYHLRITKPLVRGKKIPKLQEQSCVYKNRRYDFPIVGNQFIPTGKCGSNAYIYTCDVLPGAYVKGYKNLSMIETQREKLQLLQEFGLRVSTVNCAFPIDLLYDNPSSIVGYSMKPIQGKLLREYLVSGWTGHDLGKILEQLMLLLLELHTMHIQVNDLSFNNILIDNNDNIGLVDCDSFQITSYPGGGITKIYQHPEIMEKDFSAKLHDPHHECFALAVILFQCLFGDEPLRQVQNASDDTELNWENANFPLKIDARSSDANKNIQGIWFNQPREIRKAFYDEFTFKQDISIGSWIRLLGILN